VSHTRPTRSGISNNDSPATTRVITRPVTTTRSLRCRPCRHLPITSTRSSDCNRSTPTGRDHPVSGVPHGPVRRAA
jgi:hypothetical protein